MVTTANISGVVRETLAADDPQARVAGLAREALYGVITPARVGGLVRETLFGVNTPTRVAGLVREVLFSPSADTVYTPGPATLTLTGFAPLLSAVTPPEPPPGVPTTVQNIIPSYLYVQYQDDDVMQAFVEAYNIYAQAYMDYLNGLNLPIYINANISGPLLDWVALGIYGFVRPVFSVPGLESHGPFNTYEFNTLQFNSLVPGTPNNFIVASDDIFKRVLTWHLYRGDGRVFSVRWLKRRIARFLYGLDGTDPVVNPYTVSVELTGPFAATITVPTAYPGEIFAQAVEQGVVELPFQIAWTVVVA